MKITSITPIAAVYACETEKDGRIPSAEVLNKEQNVEFSPMFVAAGCVCVFQAFEKHVPEDLKESFEESFKRLFNEMFEKRKKYSTFIPKEEVPYDYQLSH